MAASDSQIDKIGGLHLKKLNRPWTEAEDLKLLELLAKGKATAIIGAALRRSPTAIANRISIIRLRKKAEGFHRTSDQGFAFLRADPIYPPCQKRQFATELCD